MCLGLFGGYFIFNGVCMCVYLLCKIAVWTHSVDVGQQFIQGQHDCPQFCFILQSHSASAFD